MVPSRFLDLIQIFKRFARCPMRMAHNYTMILSKISNAAFTDGLSSGIFTTSLKHAAHFQRNSEAGMVMVNVATAGVDYHVPFGGRKASSYGPREQGRYAVEFYTSVKTSYLLA